METILSLWCEDNILSGNYFNFFYAHVNNVSLHRLAFSVTINKGQGQENERVGLDLPAPVFAHGQLYTGMSRGKRGSMVKLRIGDNDEGFTDNIVYPELLG